MKKCSATETTAGAWTKGFSLVELMVAITLGLVLTAGMVQLFNSTKVTFNTNEALARVQENGRFAMERLKREIREAGTNGFCAGRLDIRNHLDTDATLDDILQFRRPLIGWEYDGTGRGDSYPIPADLTPPANTNDWTATDIGDLPSSIDNFVPGSDVLMMRRMEPLPGVTADPGNNIGGAISLQIDTGLTGTNGHGLANNPPVLVTDCATGADLFQVTNNENGNSFPCGGGGNPEPGNVGGGCDWTIAYRDNMQAFKVQISLFYVGMSDRGDPGLYVADLSRDQNDIQTQEVVEGVENMQVLYGFSRAAPDGDGQSVDTWLTADEIPSDGFGQVIALRLALLMRSPENADTDRTNQSFDLFDEDNQVSMTLNTTGDGRIRHPFSTALALRNQQLVID